MGKQMVTYRQKLVAAASGTDLVGGSAR
jgi:hypothetical protein